MSALLRVYTIWLSFSCATSESGLRGSPHADGKKNIPLRTDWSHKSAPMRNSDVLDFVVKSDDIIVNNEAGTPTITMYQQRQYFINQLNTATTGEEIQQFKTLAICPKFTYPTSECTNCNVDADCSMICDCISTAGKLVPSTTKGHILTCAAFSNNDGQLQCDSFRADPVIAKRHYCGHAFMEYTQYSTAVETHSSNCGMIMKTPPSCVTLEYFRRDDPSRKGTIELAGCATSCPSDSNGHTCETLAGSDGPCAYPGSALGECFPLISAGGSAQMCPAGTFRCFRGTMWYANGEPHTTKPGQNEKPSCSHCFGTDHPCDHDHSERCLELDASGHCPAGSTIATRVCPAMFDLPDCGPGKELIDQDHAMCNECKNDLGVQSYAYQCTIAHCSDGFKLHTDGTKCRHEPPTELR